MKLEQWRAKRNSDGAAVVSVGGWFADEQGGGKTLDVKAQKGHVIRDGEAVLEAGQLRVAIRCSLE